MKYLSTLPNRLGLKIPHIRSFQTISTKPSRQGFSSLSNTDLTLIEQGATRLVRPTSGDIEFAAYFNVPEINGLNPLNQQIIYKRRNSPLLHNIRYGYYQELSPYDVIETAQADKGNPLDYFPTLMNPSQIIKHLDPKAVKAISAHRVFTHLGIYNLCFDGNKICSTRLEMFHQYPWIAGKLNWHGESFLGKKSVSHKDTLLANIDEKGVRPEFIEQYLQNIGYSMSRLHIEKITTLPATCLFTSNANPLILPAHYFNPIFRPASITYPKKLEQYYLYMVDKLMPDCRTGPDAQKDFLAMSKFYEMANSLVDDQIAALSLISKKPSSKTWQDQLELYANIDINSVSRSIDDLSLYMAKYILLPLSAEQASSAKLNTHDSERALKLLLPIAKRIICGAHDLWLVVVISQEWQESRDQIMDGSRFAWLVGGGKYDQTKITEAFNNLTSILRISRGVKVEDLIVGHEEEMNLVSEQIKQGFAKDSMAR